MTPTAQRPALLGVRRHCCLPPRWSRLGNPIGTASWPSGRTPGTGLWRAQKICKGVNFFWGKKLECASALISALARLYNRASAHISALTPSNFFGENKLEGYKRASALICALAPSNFFPQKS